MSKPVFQVKFLVKGGIEIYLICPLSIYPLFTEI